MSDTEDVYMCEDDEDYGLVSIICFNLELWSILLYFSSFKLYSKYLMLIIKLY